MIVQRSQLTNSKPRSKEAISDVWVRWTWLVLLAGFIGWAVVGMVTAATLGLGSVAAGTIVGIAVGVAQARVLADRLGTTRLPWIVASLLAGTAGWCLSGHGGFSILRGTDASEAWTMAMGAAGGLLAGLVAGLFQWVVLRKVVHHAWIWILVNGLAWAGAVVAGMQVFGMVYSGYSSSGDDVWDQPRWWAMGLTAGGSVGTIGFAVVTGAGLGWLLRGGKPLVPAILMALANVAIVVPAGLEIMPSVQQQMTVSQEEIGMGQASTPVPIAAGTVCGNWQALEWPDLGAEPILFAPRGFDRAFQGIATSAPDDIWAIGSKSTGSKGIAPGDVLAHWDGKAWSRSSLPPEVSSNAMLHGVVALSRDDVWTVGADFSRTDDSPGSPPPPSRNLVAHYNGTGWTRMPAPSPGGYDVLYAVGATSPRDVWAVGSTGSSSGNQHPVALHWNGTEWNVHAIPVAEGNLDMGFYGVAALSPTDVWAVGAVEAVDKTPVTAHWDGSEWTQVPVPGGLLYSVSAAGPQDVWAVGTDSGGLAFGKVLALHWDGKAWSRVQIPMPAEVGALEQVVVRSPDDVWAAGWQNLNAVGFGGAWGPLLVHWDGKAWSAASLPQHRDQDRLFGLALPEAGTIWMVGTSSDDRYQKKSFGLVGRLDLSKCQKQP